MARIVSPLSFVYRFRPGVGMEAALSEDIDVYGPDHDWLYLASRVPSIQLAASVPGELEAIIAARDAAVSEAEMVGVVTVTGELSWLRL